MKIQSKRKSELTINSTKESLGYRKINPPKVLRASKFIKIEDFLFFAEKQAIKLLVIKFNYEINNYFLRLKEDFRKGETTSMIPDYDTIHKIMKPKLKNLKKYGKEIPRKLEKQMVYILGEIQGHLGFFTMQNGLLGQAAWGVVKNMSFEKFHDEFEYFLKSEEDISNLKKKLNTKEIKEIKNSLYQEIKEIKIQGYIVFVEILFFIEEKIRKFIQNRYFEVMKKDYDVFIELARKYCSNDEVEKKAKTELEFLAQEINDKIKKEGENIPILIDTVLAGKKYIYNKAKKIRRYIIYIQELEKKRKIVKPRIGYNFKEFIIEEIYLKNKNEINSIILKLAEINFEGLLKQVQDDIESYGIELLKSKIDKTHLSLKNKKKFIR